MSAIRILLKLDILDTHKFAVQAVGTSGGGQKLFLPRACEGGGGGGGGFAKTRLATEDGGGGGGGSITLGSPARFEFTSGASTVRMASLRESISDTSRSVLNAAKFAKTLRNPAAAGLVGTAYAEAQGASGCHGAGRT